MTKVFQKNEFITGLPGNAYNITNDRMYLGVVLDTYENIDFKYNKMAIMVLDHYDSGENFKVFNVINSECHFKLKGLIEREKAEKYSEILNQIKNIRFDIIGKRFNVSFFDSDYHILINPISQKIRKTPIENLNITQMLNDSEKSKEHIKRVYYNM